MSDKNFERRRDFLVKALTMGAFAASGPAGLLQPVHAMGKIPKVLPPGKSVFEIKGDVTVNGIGATQDTQIGANDTVKTGDNSLLVFAVGKDAFILRENSEVKVSGTGVLVRGLRVLTGKLLGVFGKRDGTQQLRAVTTTATIGIRGTGVYFESAEDKSYVCTCYGSTQIASRNDPGTYENVVTTHHDSPRYIYADAQNGQGLEPAPVINHTDLELMLIEELVGRVPPFGAEAADYSGPRRSY